MPTPTPASRTPPYASRTRPAHATHLPRWRAPRPPCLSRCCLAPSPPLHPRPARSSSYRCAARVVPDAAAAAAPRRGLALTTPLPATALLHRRPWPRPPCYAGVPSRGHGLALDGRLQPRPRPAPVRPLGLPQLRHAESPKPSACAETTSSRAPPPSSQGSTVLPAPVPCARRDAGKQQQQPGHAVAPHVFSLFPATPLEPSPPWPPICRSPTHATGSSRWGSCSSPASPSPASFPDGHLASIPGPELRRAMPASPLLPVSLHRSSAEEDKHLDPASPAR
nr:vegetative cell wall protein gp1-like [Aegilops tauschii subsp. strangulata]